MAKHRIGIIGFGKIARDQHAPAIAASPDFELAAISNAGGGAAPDGVPAFASFDEMLKAVGDLDAVSICTPPGPRRSIAAACLAAGKHVLLEKPPAGTVTEVGDIARRADAAGRVAFATYHAQHNEAVKHAADALAGKSLKTLDVVWKEDLRRWHPGQDWILGAGGFGIFDPGINALSILTRILPQPVFISAAELFFPDGRQAPIAANLTFASGSSAEEKLTAEFDWRQTGPQTWSIAVETTDGVKLTLSEGGSRLEILGQAPFVGPAGEYPDIYAEFARLLAAATSKVDAAPFQLVADAFMLGKRTTVEPFTF
jgi:D-galactose 1-dehydrogenase